VPGALQSLAQIGAESAGEVFPDLYLEGLKAKNKKSPTIKQWQGFLKALNQ